MCFDSNEMRDFRQSAFSRRLTCDITDLAEFRTENIVSRSIPKSWLDHLNAIRDWEIARIEESLPRRGRVLELGAGTGRQARYLLERGYDVEAIDIPTSDYAFDREFPVRDYDGQSIPFPNDSFDAVFSSNVMEHVKDLPAINQEIARVLRPEGFAVHVLPTHVWRFWTLLTLWAATPNALLDIVSGKIDEGKGVAPQAKLVRVCKRLAHNVLLIRHGERGLTALGELWFFRPQWWIAHFKSCGFDVMKDEPVGLFYTGHGFFGGRLSMTARRRLANLFGSACHLIKVAPDAKQAKMSSQVK